MFMNGAIWAGVLLGAAMGFISIALPLFNRLGLALRLCFVFASMALTSIVWIITSQLHINLPVTGDQILAAAGTQMGIFVLGAIIYTFFVMDEKLQVAE